MRQECLRCAAEAAQVSGRGSSGVGWLSVPMRIGGAFYVDFYVAYVAKHFRAKYC